MFFLIPVPWRSGSGCLKSCLQSSTHGQVYISRGKATCADKMFSRFYCQLAQRWAEHKKADKVCVCVCALCTVAQGRSSIRQTSTNSCTTVHIYLHYSSPQNVTINVVLKATAIRADGCRRSWCADDVLMRCGCGETRFVMLSRCTKTLT